MGNGLSGERVFANVQGLNHMFAPDIFNNSRDGTRVVIQFIRNKMYPKLLSHGGTPAADRQGSLWFAASVLTPHMRLDNRHPARTQRRWIKWLLWLQKAHYVQHNQIIDAINTAINGTPSGAFQPSIMWKWQESQDFGVAIGGPDAATGMQTINVTSIRGDLTEVDKLIAEEEDD
ncbi:MAG: hypothetical protein KIT36_16085 [Alphaproteobacteria bacterium]|nr:hypothetical protein [Alphaproteobacteria bacterium]